MSLSQRPGDTGAPIMSHNAGFGLTEMLDKSDYVLHEEFDAVVCDSRRLVAQIVAAHIRGNHVMVPAQRRQLMPPRIPTFGKAMKENYEVIAGAAFGIMQTNITNICESVVDSELGLRLHGDNT